MKTLQLPQMSTVKPSGSVKHSDNGDCTDHLNRNFFLKAPNLVWVSDIPYLNAGGKWYHLCIIMDLFSRKVISWKLSAKANAELVMETFKKAYEKRGAPCGLMFHSDRGGQYTSFSFRRLLDSLNVVQSFSKKVSIRTRSFFGRLTDFPLTASRFVFSAPSFPPPALHHSLMF